MAASAASRIGRSSRASIMSASRFGRVCAPSSASASRSADAASSAPSRATSSRAGATATGGTTSAFTMMPIAAPMSVSSTRSSAYSGDDAPSASTSMALMATWFDVPGVILSAQATSMATTTATRMIHVLCPNASEMPVAITTPRITPIERSIALPRDWLTLGCTTSSAAIAANTGSGPGISQPATSQAAIVAIDAFATCRIGTRFVARSVAVMPMPSG